MTAMGFGVENNRTTLYIEALSSANASDKGQERIVLTSTGDDEKQAYTNIKSALVKPLYFEQLGTVVFENTTITNMDFIKEISNINLGVYIIKTDDMKALFENETPSGVLGYDVVTLIKTQKKEGKKHIFNQLYKTNHKNFSIPTVNLLDGNLILNQAGES